jgi:hypothetical protein
MPNRWRADIDVAAVELRGEQIQGLNRHLWERLLGVGLLVVGIALATAGNLV